MKMSYQELKDKPKTLQSMTGLNPEEFETLLEGFGQAWGAYVEETFQRKERQRAYGAGRKAELESLEDKLLFILVYLRLYPTQEVQGYLFGIGQVQANEWVHRLTRVLNQTSGNEQQLPERTPSKLEKDKAARKTYYSGKKKTHTLKNNVITERGGKVVFLSDTYEGRSMTKR